MTDEKRLFITRLFQIPEMGCYKGEQKYERAEELINEFIKTDRASEVGVQPEVIKNFGGRSIFGQIQDSIGKPILLLVKVNHARGNTCKKSYTILLPETLDQIKYYNPISWKAIKNLRVKVLDKISL
mgnify:CR=1 FL=1